MNKNNIWIHLGLALVLIGMAATFGEFRSWQNERNERAKRFGSYETVEIRKPVAVRRDSTESEPEVLVKLKKGVNVAEFSKFVAKNNDRIEDKFENIKGLASIDDLDDADMETVAEQYRMMTDFVEYAQPNYQINLDQENYREVNDSDFLVGNGSLLHFINDDKVNIPNDPMFGEQWALNNEGQAGGKEKAHLDALKAWLKTQGSEDVVVAVLDTGVDYRHKDLVNNIWTRPDNVPAYTDNELGTIDDIHGYNADANSGDPMDQNGHGTHCAGIIGAEGNNGIGIAGINWNTKIMPLKFLGRGGFGSTKNAIEAINYAIDRKKNGVNVRVINASWGSTQNSKPLEDAIRAAGDAGIIFIAAAGNDGSSNDRRPHYPSNYDLPNVISVAALDRNDQMASFSNFGVKTVHIAAPGKDIVSTWLNDGFREASGTSMATPQVVGVAALIIANNPDISVEALRAKLLKSVDKLEGLDGKVKNGGRINAAMALSE